MEDLIVDTYRKPERNGKPRMLRVKDFLEFLKDKDENQLIRIESDSGVDQGYGIIYPDALRYNAFDNTIELFVEDLDEEAIDDEDIQEFFYPNSEMEDGADD